MQPAPLRTSMFEPQGSKLDTFTKFIKDMILSPVWVNWFNLVSDNRNIDTPDDIIIDNASKGLVLKDSNGHYWRVTVNTSGTLIRTDLGTSKP